MKLSQIIFTGCNNHNGGITSSITTNNNNIIKPSFENLIKQRKFQRIVTIIDQNELPDLLKWLGFSSINNKNNNKKEQSGNNDDTTNEEEDSIVLESTTNTSNTTTTALHLCCKVQPPANLIQVLLKVCNMQTNYVVKDVVDMFGRTPLHIAIINECSPEVVRLLTKDCSAPLCPDAHYLRLPLHWAAATASYIRDDNNYARKSIIQYLFSCTNSTTKARNRGCSNDYEYSATATNSISSKNNNKQKQDEERVRNMFDICTILIEAYPEAVLVKDSFGLTPIDLVEDKHIKYLFNKTIRLVQHNRKQQQHTAQKQIHNNQMVVHNNNNNDNSGSGGGTATSATHSSSTFLASGVPCEISVVATSIIDVVDAGTVATTSTSTSKYPYKQVHV